MGLFFGASDNKLAKELAKLLTKMKKEVKLEEYDYETENYFLRKFLEKASNVLDKCGLPKSGGILEEVNEWIELTDEERTKEDED